MFNPRKKAFISLLLGTLISASPALASTKEPCGQLLLFPAPQAVALPNAEVPLLAEKVLTFPNLQGTEEGVNYTRSLNLPFSKDQCGNACSYNSVAAYIEALDSFVKTGKLDTPSELEISANHLMAEKVLTQFTASLERRKRVATFAGGWVFNNLLKALRDGVVLERNYPSLTQVNTPLLIEKLNLELARLNEQYSDLLLPKSVVADTTAFAQRLIKNAFGRSGALEPEMYSLEHLKANIVVYDFEKNYFTTQHPKDSIPTKETFELTALHRLAEFEIRKTIDRGFPLLLSYTHIEEHLDEKTGIISMTESPEIEGGGHGAIIVGYQLDSNDRISMLKLKNSHANAPVIHMTMDYFRAAASTVVVLKLPE